DTACLPHCAHGDRRSLLAPRGLLAFVRQTIRQEHCPSIRRKLFRTLLRLPRAEREAAERARAVHAFVSAVRLYERTATCLSERDDGSPWSANLCDERSRLRSRRAWHARAASVSERNAGDAIVGCQCTCSGNPLGRCIIVSSYQSLQRQANFVYDF